MFPPPHNIQWYIWGRIDTIYNPICYDNMFNNAFKSLLRFLKENGFPYKCRLYDNLNELLYSGFVFPNFQIFFVQKISFATFGVSIDDFFTRYSGLGYSLYELNSIRTNTGIIKALRQLSHYKYKHILQLKIVIIMLLNV